MQGVRWNKRQGIVIATWEPKKQKILVFDAHAGVITLIPNRTLGLGAYIAYHIQGGSSFVTMTQLSFISAAEVLDMPVKIAREDILFLHHVLELCYYFLSHGSSAPDIFRHIRVLYTDANLLQSSFAKKVFLYKFFLLIGLYPEEETVSVVHTHKLISIPFQSLLAEPCLISYGEGKLTAILHRCIAIHPRFAEFQTLAYLSSV